ncbi:MAG: hypothetical protein A3G20_05375 [Acidobacteria bacterium RIFCSPLOWO2_12_FULL_59_11]|nr:MAG: hypothetical protein A3G20_05375 [Acidobacteria bacterium RIFCSPLOWO2_12_FULL_59_11]
MKREPIYFVSDFTPKGALRAHFPLWLAWLFLTRHYWLALGALMSKSPEIMKLLAEDYPHLSWLLAAEAPVLAVILANFWRTPEGGRLARVVWSAARPIMVACALVSVTLALWQHPHPEIDFGSLIAVALTIACLVLVLFGRRAVAVLADFPAATPAEPEPINPESNAPIAPVTEPPRALRKLDDLVGFPPFSAEEVYERVERATRNRDVLDGPTMLAFVQAYYHLGDMNRATDLAREVARILPNYPEALFTLGACLYALGDDSGALALARRASKLNPAEPRYRAGIEGMRPAAAQAGGDDSGRSSA